MGISPKNLTDKAFELDELITYFPVTNQDDQLPDGDCYFSRKELEGWMRGQSSWELDEEEEKRQKRLQKEWLEQQKSATGKPIIYDEEDLK